MLTKINIKEYQGLKNVIGKPLRSKKQKNGLFESDCEILKLSKRQFLATSIDSVAEEIPIGLYKKISTWAWMSVACSVSDLAVSGAIPMGITLSTQWDFGTGETLKKTFFNEANRACKKFQVPLLGGDSGYGPGHAFTSSILGSSVKMPLTRLGAQVGDYLLLNHQNAVGIGPVLAYQLLLKKSINKISESLFRPNPEWLKICKTRERISCSIDTSDGLLAATYTLAQLNNLGFELIWNEKINHRKAMNFCKVNRISPYLLWVGDHGDFQSLIVVSKNQLPYFLKKKFSIIGRFTKNRQYFLKTDGRKISLPCDDIVNCPRDFNSYKKLLIKNIKYFAN